MQRLRAMGTLRIAAERCLRCQSSAAGAGRLEIAAPDQGTDPHRWSDVISGTPARWHPDLPGTLAQGADERLAEVTFLAHMADVCDMEFADATVRFNLRRAA